MRYYETHTLPQYVLKHFGRPLSLTLHSHGVYCFKGPKATVLLEAMSASYARQMIRGYVLAKDEVTDGRVMRHIYGPPVFKTGRAK